MSLALLVVKIIMQAFLCFRAFLLNTEDYILYFQVTTTAVQSCFADYTDESSEDSDGAFLF